MILGLALAAAIVGAAPICDSKMEHSREVGHVYTRSAVYVTLDATVDPHGYLVDLFDFRLDGIGTTVGYDPILLEVVESHIKAELYEAKTRVVINRRESIYLEDELIRAYFIGVIWYQKPGEKKWRNLNCWVAKALAGNLQTRIQQ